MFMTKDIQGTFAWLIAIFAALWAATAGLLLWQQHGESQRFELFSGYYMVVATGGGQIERELSSLEHKIHTRNTKLLSDEIHLISKYMTSIEAAETAFSRDGDGIYLRLQENYRTFLTTVTAARARSDDFETLLPAARSFSERVGQYDDLKSIELQEFQRTERATVARESLFALVFMVVLLGIALLAAFHAKRQIAAMMARSQTAEDALEELNKDLEKRIAERTRELRATLDQLTRTQDTLIETEKMASLGSLVAGVAHEINTPIGIGVTASSHLREATESFVESYFEGRMKRADLENFVQVADQSAEILDSNLRRASELIKSFKQVAVDQSEDAPRQFPLKAYIDEILLSLRPKLKNAPIEVHVDIDPELSITTNPGAVSQIATNLVLNSLIHGFDDGRSGAIHFAAARDGDAIRVRYADDGKGMAEATASKVFEPFFTTKRGSGGSGLGMHIVYNLVTQSLGGAITCESRPDCGVEFNIAIPQPETRH